MYLFGASSGPGKGMDDRENRRRMKSTPKRALPAGRDSSEIDFELPLCSKYLLLAAYIASRNAATLDASLFDTGDGARASSRKKRKWASYLCLNFYFKRIELVAMCPLLVWSDELLLYSGMVRNQSIQIDFLSYLIHLQGCSELSAPGLYKIWGLLVVASRFKFVGLLSTEYIG